MPYLLKEVLLRRTSEIGPELSMMIEVLTCIISAKSNQLGLSVEGSSLLKKIIDYKSAKPPPAKNPPAHGLFYIVGQPEAKTRGAFSLLRLQYSMTYYHVNFDLMMTYYHVNSRPPEDAQSIVLAS